MPHDDLKQLGSGLEAPPDVAGLYAKAFADFGSRALWNRRASAHPTIAQALVVADSLRREGNMKARILAEQIEEACRATI
jgi:hypothetical protein